MSDNITTNASSSPAPTRTHSGPAPFGLDNGSFIAPVGTYTPESATKQAIMIGYSGASNLLNTMNGFHNSVPAQYPHFVIRRDGRILECVPHNFWSGHDGIDNEDMRHMITIQLVGTGSTEAPWPDCLASRWRGADFWQMYTDAQLHACAWLVRSMCKYYGIKPRFLPPHLRHEYVPKTIKNGFTGIVSYANFITGPAHFGPGPAFDWSALEKYLAGEPWSPSISTLSLKSPEAFAQVAASVPAAP